MDNVIQEPVHADRVTTDIDVRYSEIHERGNTVLSDQLTTKGNSQEIPLPLVRAAIVVGPARDGIQKKPSVKSP